ncbi:MAG: lysylphosphatidylglycerol synthase transmembrane domain-containing protein [Chloroflexota bacterium]
MTIEKTNTTTILETGFKFKRLQALIPLLLIGLGVGLPILFLNRYAEQITPILDLFRQINTVDLLFIIPFWLLWLATQIAQFTLAYRLIGIPARLRQLAEITIGNHFVNLFLPSGNLSTFALFAWHATRRGWPAGRTPFALVLFALAQYASLSLLIVISFLILPPDTPLFAVGLSAGAALIGGTIVSWIIFLTYIFKREWFNLIWRLAEMLPFRIAERFSNHPLSQQGFEAISAAQEAIRKADRTLWLQFIGSTILNRIAYFLLIWGCGQAFDLTLPFEGIVSASGVGVLFTAVSPIPMGVGFAESGIAIALSQFNISLSGATAIAVLSRGFTLWLTVLVGGLLLLRMGIGAFTATWSDGAQTQD